jgi:hypothetical protein
MLRLCAVARLVSRAYGHACFPPGLIELEASAMTDLIFLALGGGAFVLFAVLAAALKRM